MTLIVAMASLKGGAGKTTISLNLAVAAENAGVPTVIIDVDPQQAAAKWGDLRAETGRPPTVISAMASRLPQALRSAAQVGAKMVVIDTAAHAEGILVPSIDAVDLVLIPCRPTILDLQHLSATVRLSDLRRKDHMVVLNAVQSRTIDRDQAERALADMGINSARAGVSNLVAYPRALTAGQGATEFEPEGRAAAEMRLLLAEIMAMYPALLGPVDREETQSLGSAVFNWLKPAGLPGRHKVPDAVTQDSP
jgi:chromosome partitioning protein